MASPSGQCSVPILVARQGWARQSEIMHVGPPTPAACGALRTSPIRSTCRHSLRVRTDDDWELLGCLTKHVQVGEFRSAVNALHHRCPHCLQPLFASRVILSCPCLLLTLEEGQHEEPTWLILILHRYMAH